MAAVPKILGSHITASGTTTTTIFTGLTTGAMFGLYASFAGSSGTRTISFIIDGITVLHENERGTGSPGRNVNMPYLVIGSETVEVTCDGADVHILAMGNEL